MLFLNIYFFILFFRLTWQGFPVFISGRSTPTGRFFPSHVTLQSHEDTKAYTNVYKYVQGQVGNPAKRLGDGAKEITAAGNEVSVNKEFGCI